ncbi:hypothetical protein OESDEN_10453 [Oesophagostomum dentatum]|uniref:Cytosolic fatty-acid binding proteins domain-containing protein n=1 Tax=Oesophagostomum dentatum TaxID=61180 RepID=A0A0B1T2W5_OESDE|nr:hypothetical protein OESDEN_10453 [Oesophagostomum dentatum]
MTDQSSLLVRILQSFPSSIGTYIPILTTSTGGYGWVTRKLVTFATFKKEFTKSDKPGKFDYSNLTSKKDVHYKDIELGKEFVAEGLDSTKHKITFDLVGDVLFEKHVPTEAGEAKDETYEYSFVAKDGKEYMLVKMEANGVVGKRFYKRL